jgi:hypothetical protein
MEHPILIDGGVLPAGIHDMTCDQVREMFVLSDARNDLWGRFDKFLDRLKDTVPIPVTIYLDGSFITCWDSCWNIDVIVEAREFGGENRHFLRMLTDLQVRAEFKEDFNVFIHVVVPGLFSKDYRQWFQRVKADDVWRFGGDPERLRKGIVRLVL